MPNKVQYFIENNVCVVMKGYFLSRNKYWTKGEAFDFFFFCPAVEFAGIVPKAIVIILVKKAFKLL